MLYTDYSAPCHGSVTNIFMKEHENYLITLTLTLSHNIPYINGINSSRGNYSRAP